MSWSELPDELRLPIVAAALPGPADKGGLDTRDTVYITFEHGNPIIKGAADMRDYLDEIPHNHEKPYITISETSYCKYIEPLLYSPREVRLMALEEMARSPIFLDSFDMLIRYLRMMHSAGFIEHVHTIILHKRSTLTNEETEPMSSAANYLAMFPQIRVYFIWERIFQHSHTVEVEYDDAIGSDLYNNQYGISLSWQVDVVPQYSTRVGLHGLWIKDKWCKIWKRWWRLKDVPLNCVDHCMEMEIWLSRCHHVSLDDAFLQYAMNERHRYNVRNGEQGLEFRDSPPEI